MANKPTIYLISNTGCHKTTSEAVKRTLILAGYRLVDKAAYRRHMVKLRRAKHKAERQAAWDLETAKIAAEAVAEAVAIISNGQR